MIYQIVDPNEWLYEDSVVQSNGKEEAYVHAARRSYAAVQILLNGLKLGEPIEACSIDIPFPMEAYQLMDVPVEANTGPVMACHDNDKAEGYITRKAPFRVFDIVKPLTGQSAAIAATGGLYFCWLIPSDAMPGLYCGSIDIRIGSEKCTVPVKIKVYTATLPEKETLHSVNWYNMENIWRYHKLERWSDAHWDMYRKYLRAMRRIHQNYASIDLHYIEVTKDENGDYCFDLSLVEKFGEISLSEGFSYLEFKTLLGRRQYADGNFVLVWGDKLSPLSDEGHKQLVQFLKAWGSFLRKKGWYDIAVQHIGDEPFGNLINEYRAVAAIVRRYLPGMPILEAVETLELKGCVDIWIPKNNLYQEHQEEFEALGRLGDVLWYYTCCTPGGYYINRFMDIPLIKSRYLAWGNYRYGLAGYLHWGFNYYVEGQNPFETSCVVASYSPDTMFPAGDTHIVYPGDEGPWYSVRLEAIRAGIEDYELLKQLASKDQALADQIAASCVTQFDHVELDLDRFEANRIRILEAMERLQ